MSKSNQATRWLTLAALSLLPLCAIAADQPATAKPAAAKPAAAKPAAATPAAMTDAQLIASALSAAPAGVAKHATVVAMDEKGGMRTLREGSNGFTCLPDNPATPGPDPMCADKASMGWMHAMMTHATPPAGKTGLMYMLAGGTDASNTDPYAEKPTATNHWIKTGPHVMVAGVDSAFLAQYSKDPDPDTAVPYVMWAGTPYQHLMVPVK